MALEVTVPSVGDSITEVLLGAWKKKVGEAVAADDALVEFESEKIERLETEISEKLGFSVKTQRLQITGACEQMKKSGTCKNRACS